MWEVRIQEDNLCSFRSQAGGSSAIFNSRLPRLPGHGHLQQAEERNRKFSCGRFFMGLALQYTFLCPETSHMGSLTTREAGKCSLCAQEKKRKWVSESSNRLSFKTLLEDKQVLAKLRAFIKDPNQDKPDSLTVFSLNNLFFYYITHTIKN